MTDDIMTDPKLFEIPADEDTRGLAGRFAYPPFSVLHAASGTWQARKSRWLQLGIESEVGRGENLLHMSEAALKGYERSMGIYAPGRGGAVKRAGGGWMGTSIFDPVLCELAYRWWCPPGGAILDPFAGGSVRGIVACHRSMQLFYDGLELRPEQVQANREQAERLGGDLSWPPQWTEGDSLLQMYNLAQGDAAQSYDMVFTCPPYGRLEVYSDLPGELSAMSEEEFDASLYHAVDLSTRLLAPDRFSVWVIGDERRKDGSYHGIPWHLIQAGVRAGMSLYNIAILVTATGSLAIRTGRLFRSQRKLGPMHQYVVVFLKGDPRKAGAACQWPNEERDLERAGLAPASPDEEIGEESDGEPDA